MDKAVERRLIPIAKNKQKLNYRFHNPNTPEATAEFLYKLFIEVNRPKVEAAIRAAEEEAMAKDAAEKGQRTTKDLSPEL